MPRASVAETETTLKNQGTSIHYGVPELVPFLVIALMDDNSFFKTVNCEGMNESIRDQVHYRTLGVTGSRFSTSATSLTACGIGCWIGDVVWMGRD